MLMSSQMDGLLAEWKVLPAHENSKVLANFFKEYGEYAEWEDWLTFLKERPELKGFEWARSLADRPNS